MFIFDLHIHSRYSRATSKNLTLEELDRVARMKGVQVLGTGDFTHPLWLKELEDQLQEAEPGLYVRKHAPPSAPPAGGRRSGWQSEATRFMLTAEIASIYSKGGKVRKVHTLLFAPSLAVARTLQQKLDKLGNVRSDGRPILGLDVKELTKIALDVSEDCMIVPAHAWTPWFSVFGSKSGFDSLEECFEEMTPHIYAIETGLSSDPAMNWRVSSLDSITLLSNSDCHSAPKIGREANVFYGPLDYFGFREAVRKKDREKFLFTIEFFPEEGKYHYDGHRLCGVRIRPSERMKPECPKCGRSLTVGVLSRVEELADRPEGYTPPNAIPYKNLVSLQTILGEAYNVGAGSKIVQREYEKLINSFDNELNILLNKKRDEIAQVAGKLVAEGIERVRAGKLTIEPGYDGAYGTIYIFTDAERTNFSQPQATLL